MKCVIILSMVVALSLGALETYPKDYDHFDIEKALEDPAFVKGCIDCFLDKGPCVDVAAFFKKYNVLPEAMQQACAKCTPAQKHMMRRFFEVAPKILPNETAELQKKIDPEGKYAPAFMAAIAQA